MSDQSKRGVARAVLFAETFSTFTQQAAVEYYALGLNVFPLPFGAKEGGAWQRLQTTRLYHNPADRRPHDLLDITSEQVNLAVMCGRTSGNLFILDCETRAALEYHVSQVHARGIALHVVASPSRRGGGHIYFRSAAGEVANITPGTMRDTELRGTNVYALLPPSKHPAGGLYQWLHRDGDAPPVVDPAAIDWLVTTDGKPIQLTTRQYSQRPAVRLYTPFNPSTVDYQRSGHTIAEGARNNRLFSAACDYAANDMRSAEAERDLYPRASASGLSDHEINVTIRKAYGKPRRKYKRNAPRSTHWQCAAAFAASHQWSGRSGQTDRAVFMAFVERARVGSNGAGTFRATQRELMELAHVSSFTTVAKALTRLKHDDTPSAYPAPFICYAGQDKTGGQGNLWRFSDYVLREGNRLLGDAQKNGNDETVAVCIHTQGLSSSATLSSFADVYERGAIGSIGLEIYHTLMQEDDPVNVPKLAEELRRTPRQIRYYLKKLLDCRLAKQHGRGLYIGIPATNEQIEYEGAGAKRGTTARRRARHARERALYAGMLLHRSLQWTAHPQLEVLPLPGGEGASMVNKTAGQIITITDTAGKFAAVDMGATVSTARGALPRKRQT
jgi:hypothetical protein